MTYSDVSRRIVNLYRKMGQAASNVALEADSVRREELKQERDKLYTEIRELEKMLDPA